MEGILSEVYQWRLIDGFIKNDHREEMFTPSTMVFVDESISYWYVICGEWINYGFPMYVEIDHKPENDCYTQARE